MILEEFTGKNIGAAMALLLINFKNARLEWKRVLRPQESVEGGDPDLRA